MFKKLDITTDSSKGGLPVDTAFMEFNEMFPGLVDGKITHPADQMQALADFAATAKDKQQMTIDEYFGESAKNVKSQMHEMFNDNLKEFLNGSNDEIRFSFDNTSEFLLPRDEYSMVSSAIMNKNAGLKDSQLPPVDYVFAADEFYVYKNNSLGNFSVIDKLNTDYDAEIIDYIRGEIDYGNVKTAKDIDRCIEAYGNERRVYTLHNERFENRRTDNSYDGLHRRTSRGNGDSTSAENGGDTKRNEKVD